MHDQLISTIETLNPWLVDQNASIHNESHYIPRYQTAKLLLPEWDNLWLILVGPRQAGKTTLGKHLCHQLIHVEKRFTSLLYLNCDYLEIRQWLKTPAFIKQAQQYFRLKNPIIFIDEVQRLENPGLLLKTIADLKLPIKMIATGSSQLELRSQVQEFLTGRHLESLVLPLSFAELNEIEPINLTYGCYPAIVQSTQKKLILQQLYRDYIQKDIIEILKIGKPDILQNLVSLIAHSSGQLVNYQQLATDCQTSIPTIQNYISILKQTYTISELKPFVGNKRKEIKSNPIYYFIDNGFRNQALHNFTPLSTRQDTGLLIESAIFQEILKLRAQHFLDFKIHFWRTQSGAEVDFILRQGQARLLPIEVKYQNMTQAKISRSFRSFIDAYQPQTGIFVTKDFNDVVTINNCSIHFISLTKVGKAIGLVEEWSSQ